MGAESSTGTPTGTEPVTPAATDPAAPEGGTGPEEKLSQEAARHRVRAKDAETARDAAIGERDALAAVVTGLRTSIVDDLAEKAGISPALLWASGVTVDELLSDAADGEDGAGLIDTGKVDAAIEAAREKFDVPVRDTDSPGYNPTTGRDHPEPKRSKFLDALGR